MERRREPRVRVDEPVRLTVLSDEQGPEMEARIIELSGRGLRISLPGPLRIGSAVKIERAGELWLGEVVYVRTNGDGCHAGIQVEQALRQTQHLEQLRRAVCDFSPSPSAAVKP